MALSKPSTSSTMGLGESAPMARSNPSTSSETGFGGSAPMAFSRPSTSSAMALSRPSTSSTMRPGESALMAFSKPNTYPTVDFGEVNQDCQLLIFNLLHLTDLIHLRAMCRTLNDTFFVHSRGRHSLTLKIGQCQATGPNDLVITNLNKEICDFLLDTFSGLLTNLTIVFNRVPDSLLKQLGYLLIGWSGTLESLSIDLQLIQEIEPENGLFRVSQMIKLLKQLNRLEALRSLSLKSNLREAGFSYNLPILRQLRHFTFETDRHFSCIYESLRDYAETNDHLRTLDIIFIEYEEWERRQILNLPDRLTRKFTSFGSHFWMHRDEVKKFAPKFPSLTKLAVNLTGLDYQRYLVEGIASLGEHLRQLAKLKLRVNLRNSSPPYPLIPMPSVKVLDLILNTSSHEDIRRCLDPVNLLPNLEEASTTILEYHCIRCRLNSHSADLRAINACRGVLEWPFYDCPLFRGNVIQLE